MIVDALRRLRPKRRIGWLWVIITACTLANDLRLRARVDALQRISDDERAANEGKADPVADGWDPDHTFVTAAGVHLDDATRGAASHYARRHHLDVLDLVPGDLGTEQVLDIARMVDPATYASNPLAPGHGPRQATLVHRAVLERVGIKAVDQLDPVTYFETIAELKKFAPKSTDLAIAAGLNASPESPSQRRAYLSARFSKAMPVVVAIPAVQFTLLGAGLLLAPGWGAAALASYLVQPYLAIGGTGLRPRISLLPVRSPDRSGEHGGRSAPRWTGRRQRFRDP